jgi:hypothetical protein
MLQQQTVHARILRGGSAEQQRRVALGMTHNLLGQRIEQDLTEAPHARAIQRIRGLQRRRRASVKQRSQLAAALGGRMLHRQQPVAAVARGLCGSCSRFGSAVRAANDHEVQ